MRADPVRIEGRSFLLTLLAFAASGSSFSQTGWGGLWLGGVHTFYARSSSVSVNQPALDIAYGARFSSDLSRGFRFMLDLGVYKRHLETDLFLPYTGSVLLTTTRTDLKSIALGIGGAVTLFDGNAWETRVLFGAVISAPYSVSIDVSTPYGTGSRYTDAKHQGPGVSLKLGGRYAYSIGDGLWLFVEGVAWIALKDEYEWVPSHGPGIDPIVPKSIGGITCTLGFEFGPKAAKYQQPQD
ncbi:MAG: hypothetical protein ABI432_02415 [Flavobacteriales bacterium]